MSDLTALTRAFARAPHADAVPRASGMSMDITLDAGRMLASPLTLEALTGHVRITSGRRALDPVSFGVLDGRGEGSVVTSWARHTRPHAGAPPRFETSL